MFSAELIAALSRGMFLYGSVFRWFCSAAVSGVCENLEVKSGPGPAGL